MENDIYEIIAIYIAGETLSEEEREKLEQWRKEKQEFCLLGEMQLSVQLVREHGGIHAEAAYRQVEKKMSENRVKIKRKNTRRYTFVSIAAGILLFLGVSLMWRMQSTVPNGETEIPSIPGNEQVTLTLSHGKTILLKRNAHEMILTDTLLQITNEQNTLVYTGTGRSTEKEDYNVLTVPAGAEYRVILSDGTKVFLNSGTEFRYPEVFQGAQRKVYLKGEAWFEVAKDSTHAFFVHTENMDIQVLGTSFNVKAYKTLETVATTLVTGSVEVTCKQEVFRIVPGEQFTYNKDRKRTNVRQVDTEMYTSWKDGYYKFRQTTLEEIMTTLSLWYGINVFYVNEKVKQLEFTGRLKRYEDIGNLFRQFEQTGNVTFKQTGNNVIIQSK